jgi:hypothetical protein
MAFPVKEFPASEGTSELIFENNTNDDVWAAFRAGMEVKVKFGVEGGNFTPNVFHPDVTHVFKFSPGFGVKIVDTRHATKIDIEVLHVVPR